MFTDTVSVNGDSVIQPKHYGSLFTMADYTTTAHTVYLNLAVLPSQDWVFSGRVVFNLSEAAYDEVIMTEVSSEVASSLNHQDFTFDEMHTYSDIDYSYVQAGVGVEYRITPTITWTADTDYADLKDDSGGYVYGLESGSYFMVRTGVQFEF